MSSRVRIVGLGIRGSMVFLCFEELDCGKEGL